MGRPPVKKTPRGTATAGRTQPRVDLPRDIGKAIERLAKRRGVTVPRLLGEELLAGQRSKERKVSLGARIIGRALTEAAEMAQEAEGGDILEAGPAQRAFASVLLIVARGMDAEASGQERERILRMIDALADRYTA